MPERLSFESEGLVLTVNPDTGSFKLLHKPSNTDWGEDPWHQEVGEIRTRQSGRCSA